MTVRTRLTAAGVVLLVSAATAACGGGSGSGAPESASKDDFCSAQQSLFTSLDLGDGTELPSEKELADAMHTWADKIEEVGTPENISDDARKGFEETVKAAHDVSEADLKSPDLDSLEADMSDEAKKQVEAFSSYVNDTCGSMFGDLETPEVPEAG